MKHHFFITFLFWISSCSIYAVEDSNYSINNLGIEDGLTQSDVTSITQDHTGFIWLSTNNGLNRFDGHRMVTFKHSFASQRSSLSSNLISSIVTDSANCLWIASKKEGIDRYDPETNTFEHFISYYNRDKSIALHNISKIYHSPQNRIYACTQNLLLVYQPESKRFIPHKSCPDLAKLKAQVLDIHSDAEEQSLFIATSQGVFWYKVQEEKLKRLSTVPSNVVYFHPTMNTLLYMTDQGLIRHDLKSGRKQQLLCDNNSLRRVTTLLADSRGYLWIGTRNGLYVERSNNIAIPFETEPDCHILSLYEDSSKNIWIGKRTYGVTSISLKPGKFRLYNQMDNQPFTPAAFAIYPETQDSIWIATKQGKLHLIDREKNTLLATVQFPTGNINAISPHPDKSKLWLAGTQGLYLFDKQTHHFSHIPESTVNGFITSLFPEADSILWCASRNGLFVYKHDRMQRIYPLKNDTEEEQNTCRIIFVEKDTIWAGTISKGLVKIIRQNGNYQCFPNTYGNIPIKDISFVRKTGQGDLLVGTWGGGVYIRHKETWRHLTEEDGLADNIVFAIYEDSKNNYWISTYNGLSHFNTTTHFLTKYEMHDGLPNNEFSVGAHYLFNYNELFLGTVNGIISFIPSEMENIDMESNILPTDMYLYDRRVEIGIPINGKVILQQPLYQVQTITLSHQIGFFSFDLTDFNYSSKVRPLVRYKLEGWDKQWNALPSNLNIKYTNVPPGNYQLRVYNQQKDGGWKEKNLLNIHIKPPFYATPWAFAGYYTIGILIIIAIIAQLRQRNRLNRLLFEEQTQKKYQEQFFLTRMKFYTNVSHELRTPLTLILGMLERIRSEVDEESPIVQQLHIAKRNAEKLHLLINDILDLRKIENQSMKVQKENRNIISFIQTIVSYFKEMADDRHIRITFSHPSDILICAFDVDKTEKIIYNLLSNAVKYTTDYIAVTLSIGQRTDGQSIIEIAVTDNGRGIAVEEQQKIFSRYYQTEDSTQTDSTGIGLHLAMEMAQLQNGNITVCSTSGEGATFTLTLPVGAEDGITDIAVLENSDKPVLLLVDDNEDMLYYMSEILQNEYILYTASNGKQAIKIANKIIPDILICDIMMPDISGIEVCQRLKNESMTCHITIILISARGAEQIRIDGLSLGADIYMTKPFSEDYFKAQIKSLVVNRALLKKQIRQELMQVISKESPHQDEVLQKVVSFVEQNLTNENYDLEQLSKDMGMSRMGLYRKIKSCTDQSPGEFIREYRLRKSAELLAHSELPISDICFYVGFNDIKSFRTAFKKKYSTTPSDFRKGVHTP